MLIRIGKPHHFYQPGLERVVDREIRHQPLVERSLGLGRAGAVPGRRREVEHKAETRGLRNPFENFAPLDVIWVLPLARSLLAVYVMRFVINDDEITPAASNRRIGAFGSCLARRRIARNTDCGINRPSSMDVRFADPIVALRFERDALPVAHQHVWPELLAILRRDHLKAS